MTNSLYPRDYIKIGRTSNLPRRVNELNNQMINNHILPIYYFEIKDNQQGSLKEKELEKHLHQLFADYRISKRREWFQLNPKVVIKAINEYS